jgi:histidinol-phosphatase (PHP family)
MIANYHTHTQRCHHASGKDEEYVQKAIAEGLKILGFSDHAPYIYPDGYISYYKMTPEESGEYFSSIKALAEKYKDKINIHIGYEAEYYPALWQSTLEFWENTNPPEYLILGQHFIREEYPQENRIHSAESGENKINVKIYADTVTEAIATGKFTYIAHPDVINYYGDDLDYYREQMTRIIKAAKAAGLPLEINLLGLSEKRNYPTPLFWETASKFNPEVIIGCDAHEPERVADKNEILEALRFADKYHLNVVEEVKLINPFA